MGELETTGNGRKERDSRQLKQPGTGIGCRAKPTSRHCTGHPSRFFRQSQQIVGQSALEIDFALVIFSPGGGRRRRQGYCLGMTERDCQAGYLPGHGGSPTFDLQPIELRIAHPGFSRDGRRYASGASQAQYLSFGGGRPQSQGAVRAFVEQLLPMQAQFHSHAGHRRQQWSNPWRFSPLATGSPGHPTQQGHRSRDLALSSRRNLT